MMVRVHSLVFCMVLFGLPFFICSMDVSNESSPLLKTESSEQPSLMLATDIESALTGIVDYCQPTDEELVNAIIGKVVPDGTKVSNGVMLANGKKVSKDLLQKAQEIIHKNQSYCC